MNFHIEAGETVGVIGGTGSGKSTLLKLLLQFYETTSGQLLINDMDINTIRTKDLRQRLSYVPQQSFFFTDTIRGNIQYSNPEASDEEMLDHLATAQVSSFIDVNNHESLDREIIRGGANYSGGQRQRLAIARTLARNASVYLFDDSFSALDFRTDYYLRKELEEQLADKMAIIVAQRVATIRHCDKIIVLDNGQMAGIGSHDELLKSNQIYHEIAVSQGEEEVVQ